MSSAEDMLEIYERWHSMFLPIDIKFDVNSSDKVFGCGYGASLIPLLISGLFYGEDKILCLKPGEMPGEKHRGETLVVVSHSGETVETLECARRALQSGMKVYAVTGGGRLEEFAIKEKINYVKINKEKSTRLGFPYIMSGLAPLLDKMLSQKMTENIGLYFKKLSEKEEALGEQARKIADFLKNSFLAGVYYSNGAEAHALRFRYLLSENAKLHAVYENIMEVAHNGITAWEMYYNMPIMMIGSTDDDKLVSERFKVISEALQGLGHRVYEMNIGKNDDIIDKLFVIDVSTIFLSIYRNVNPFITRTQETVRRKVGLNYG
ncbi:MAG: SIS domain-containing protein [Nitrososphaeria archaeon]